MLLVNAMEGEPASAKDRVLLNRVPHLVLDGTQVAAAVVGAGDVRVCVPANRPVLAQSVRHALSERARARLDPVIPTIEQPPAHYAAGEESALADWVAGRDGLPSFRVSKANPLTIRRRPVIVHNVETLAHLALIARYGGEWFRSAGLPDAPGTTLVTISGAVPAPEVIEVALGTPIAEVLEQAGVTETPQAILLGGYGGSWLSGEDLGTPYAPAPLATMRASVGTGVIGVLPQGACGLAETARIVSYLSDQKARQCGPCTFGLPAIAEDMVRLAVGRGDSALVERLRLRLDAVEGRGACRLPDGAVRLTRSALSIFAADVHSHSRHHPCPGWNHRGVLEVPNDRGLRPAPRGRR
jgi:NADH:ubiquinone oxidoreductase subunit F (NADH-binding)